jgi:hypothetical protein
MVASIDSLGRLRVRTRRSCADGGAARRAASLGRFDRLSPRQEPVHRPAFTGVPMKNSVAISTEGQGSATQIIEWRQNLRT